MGLDVLGLIWVCVEGVEADFIRSCGAEIGQKRALRSVLFPTLLGSVMQPVAKGLHRCKPLTC